MKVRSGAVAGNGQTIEIEVEMSDMRDLSGFDELSPYEQWKRMTGRADLFIVEYKARNNDVTPEWAAARMREIKEKAGL